MNRLLKTALALAALIGVACDDGQKDPVSSTPKPIEITSRLAGLTFRTGDNLTVTWSPDLSVVSKGFVIELSTDSGKNYQEIQNDEQLSVTQTTYTWAIPESTYSVAADDYQPINSTQCYLKVSEYDLFEHSDSAGPFSILPR